MSVTEISSQYPSIIAKKTGHPRLSFFIFRLLFFVITGGLLACHTDERDLSKMKPYDGPRMEIDTVETLYSDSARVRVRMTAPKELQMENEDLIFPKGVYIEFFNENQAVSSTLRGNHGTYNKKKNLYTVTGKVVVVDSVKGQTMNTEELHWEPIRRKIYTDKFVTIQTQQEILKGQGLEAEQDFSNYKILRPTGVFPVPQ